MNNSNILLHLARKKVIELTHQCKTENGIEDDENFIITEVIGSFEQLEITNQYNQKHIINPNQLKDEL